MKFHRSIFAAVLTVAALGAASVAQARGDVSWSIGVGAPGAQVVVGNAPVYVQPAPVYYQPAPVYYQPPPPVYVRPAPVYYQPQPVYVRPEPVYYQPQVVYPGWGRHHGHHRDWDGDGRWNR
ncbi:MAG: hypothetical protein NTZ15_01140 [Burkholderiales bacterium]|jgi:hypothetical protein|nr:hypothetical protein [Burkholderiales bacterium]